MGQASTQAGGLPLLSLVSKQKLHFMIRASKALLYLKAGIEKGQATMQVLQPTQTLSS
jgi:hypothetical protein